MGEAKRRKLVGLMDTEVKGARSAKPDDVMVPRAILDQINALFPGLAKFVQRSWPHYERQSSMPVASWCPVPIDLIRSAMLTLREEGVYRTRPIAAVGEHEASILAGFLGWSERRQILVLDRSVWNDTASLSALPLPERDVLLNIPSKAVYITTPGLHVMDQPCAGIMVHVDDQVVDGRRLDPELQLVCMLDGQRSRGSHDGLAAMIGTMGGAQLAGLTPMVLTLPLPEGDIEAGYERFVQQKMKRLETMMPGASKLFGEMADLRKQMMSSPLLPPELKEQLSAMASDAPGVLGEHRQNVMGIARLVAHVIRMGTAGDHEVRLAGGLDNPAGEVRVIGRKMPSTAAAGISATLPEAQSHEQLGLIWRTSGHGIDVDGLVANSPTLAHAAEGAFLKSSNGVGVVLPQAHLAADDVRRNVHAMFPGLGVRILSPSRFDAVAPEGTRGDVFLVMPCDDPWSIGLKAVGDDGLYVHAIDLLRVLGRYVMARVAFASGAAPHEKVPCFKGAAGLVWSIETQRGLIAGDPLKIVQRFPEVIGAVCEYFTGYVIASIVGLDPRLVTFGILKLEQENRSMEGLSLGYQGDLRYVVGIPEALSNFLSRQAGLSREKWQDMEPMARCVAVAEAAKVLIEYQDAVASEKLSQADGGIKWVPEPALDRMAKSMRQSADSPDEAVMQFASFVFDGMEEMFVKSAAGPEMSTMLQSWNLEGKSIAPGEAYSRGIHGGEEHEFVARMLANPRCIFVQRISEAWMSRPGASGLREEGYAVRFITRTGEVRGAYKILSRNPVKLDKMALHAI